MKPHITYHFNEDRSKLILKADTETQAQLAEMRENQEKLQNEFSLDTSWGTTICEIEILENLTCNSELQWIDAVDTQDLTDAPMLGILENENKESRIKQGPQGAILVGGDENGAWYIPIMERWGYEPYQIKSFLDDLADKGEAVFQNNW